MFYAKLIYVIQQRWSVNHAEFCPIFNLKGLAAMVLDLYVPESYFHYKVDIDSAF